MTDDFFTTNDISGKGDADGFIEVAWNTGKAFADWLPTMGDVVVLRQGEATEQIVGAVIEGVRLQGRNVVDAGSGDGQRVAELITQHGYAGGVVVGYEAINEVTTVELYNETGIRIDTEHGLQTIAELVEAGNFVPSRIKGELRNDTSSLQHE